MLSPTITAPYDALCGPDRWSVNPQQHPESVRPLIGITGTFVELNCRLAQAYYLSVLRAGGMPVVLPPFRVSDAKTAGELAELLSRLDGIVFSGGGDIRPAHLGEEALPQVGSPCDERDEQELLLVRLAADRQIPMLGICRGIQVMMAALGGSLLQDIYAQRSEPTLQHSQDLPRDATSHDVIIDEDSLLFQIYGTKTLPVNSFHHQAVREAAPGFRVSARATDGVIEAVESTDHKSMLGVQWHPECLPHGQGRDVFDWLISEAKSFRQAKAVHSRILSLDSHCDTPMFFGQNIDFQSRDRRILVDLHKMNEGHLDASIMVAYLPQGERTPAALQAATAQADSILTQIEQMVAKSPEAVAIARTPDDLYASKAAGRKSIMMGIENGYAIGRDISNVARFRQRGVVYMTLCHNGDNDICDSARGQHEHGGLSSFGREVVQEMNRVGMLVDLSHGGEQSFYDALEVSQVPIVCSHSSARALCDHPRNLTDDQLRALARKGGVAQVTLYHGFLRPDPEPASILDAIAHLNHMVEVAGIEHVGIGTDFDGDGGVSGCADASELINFTRQLLRNRYSEPDIRLIWGENFLRVMRQAQRFGR